MASYRLIFLVQNCYLQETAPPFTSHFLAGSILDTNKISLEESMLVRIRFTAPSEILDYVWPSTLAARLLSGRRLRITTFDPEDSYEYGLGGFPAEFDRVEAACR